MDRDGAGATVLDRVGRVPEQARRGWPPVAVLGTGTFAIGTDMFVMAGILGGIGRDLGVPVGTAGLAVTAFAVAYAAGTVLLGALLGPRSPRRVLVGAAVLFGVMSALSAGAPTLPALLATRVLGALAAAVYVPAAGAAAVAAVPESHRGRALGVLLCGTSAAVVLGAPLGVWLASALSWRAAFAWVAVLAAATVVGLLVTGVGSGPSGRAGEVPSDGFAAVGARLRTRLRPVRRPAAATALGVTFLVMTASYSLYTYLPGLSAAAAGPLGPGLFIAAFGVGGVGGAWWGGAVADRRGAGRVVGAAVAALTVGFAALPHLAAAVPGMLAVMVGWGLAAWGFVPAQQHRLIGLGAGPVPLLLAMHSCAVHLGSAAGALLGGLVVDTAGAGRLWVLAVACCAGALTLHGVLVKEVGT